MCVERICDVYYLIIVLGVLFIYDIKILNLYIFSTSVIEFLLRNIVNIVKKGFFGDIYIFLVKAQVELVVKVQLIILFTFSYVIINVNSFFMVKYHIEHTILINISELYQGHKLPLWIKISNKLSLILSKTKLLNFFVKQLFINLEVRLTRGRIDFSKKNIRHAVSIKI